MAGDTYSPAAIATDQSGNAEFAGHVKAAGVDLLSGVSDTPPADRRVRWTRQADGSLVADLYAFDIPASGPVPAESHLSIQAYSPDLISTAGLDLRAINAGAVVESSLTARSGGETRKVLDSLGRSDFAQLLGASKMRIAPMSGTLTWLTGGPFSDALTLYHGLGATPLVVLLGGYSIFSGGAFQDSCVVNMNGQPSVAKTPTTVGIFGESRAGGNMPAGSTAGVDVLAIG